MHEYWFNQNWKRTRDGILVTPENYDPDSDEFNRRLKSAWDKVKEVPHPARVSFPMERIGQLAQILAGEDPGHFYARFGSQSHDALRHMLLQAEAGYVQDIEQHLAAASFPAGMSAIDTVVEELVRHIPVGRRKKLLFLQGEQVYSKTNNVLAEGLEEKGLLPAVKVDTANLDEVEAALKKHKRNVVGIVYEPITNPTLKYTDTRALAALVHRFGVPVIVDNTFLTPYLQQPFRMGADIVIHSATKYMGGEGDMLAGVAVVPVSFMYGKGTTSGMYALQTRTGRVLNPEQAYTLAERFQHLSSHIEDQVTNACHVADYLEKSGFVESVYYPDLRNETRSGTAGGVVSFVVKGNTDSEKIAHEKALIQYLIDHKDSAPITFEASLGDKQYFMLGFDALGFPSPHEPGFVRFAVGRTPNVKNVAAFLDQAFKHVYNN